MWQSLRCLNRAAWQAHHAPPRTSSPPQCHAGHSSRLRMLKGAGTDIHAFAERIAKPNGGLTDAEMRKLYDAGYEAGVRAVENKQHGSGDFHNVDGLPSWNEIALFCQQNNDRLRPTERQFIDDIASRTV